MKSAKHILFALAVTLFPFSTAFAIPITINFTASGFSSTSPGGVAAPQDVVSGTIVYEAASETATIDSITSISLNIAGYNYSVGEVGFISPFGGSQLIGGNAINEPNAILHGTDDFWLIWDPTTMTGTELAYSSSSVDANFWSTRNFDSFTVSSSVPEPTSLALLGLGLAGISFARRKQI